MRKCISVAESLLVSLVGNLIEANVLRPPYSWYHKIMSCSTEAESVLLLHLFHFAQQTNKFPLSLVIGLGRVWQTHQSGTSCQQAGHLSVKWIWSQLNLMTFVKFSENLDFLYSRDISHFFLIIWGISGLVIIEQNLPLLSMCHLSKLHSFG